MTPAVSTDSPPTLEHRRFTVDDYYRMADAGILSEDDRVELLDGEIIEMSPIGPGHNTHVIWFHTHFQDLNPRRAIVQVQGPLRLNEKSEPVPDLLLLKPRQDLYRNGLPRPQDVFLLIEVADSTVRKDRDVKLPLCAEAGVPEVWIFLVGDKVIEAYTEPFGRIYQKLRRFRAGETLAPAAFPDHVLKLDDLIALRF